MGVAALRTKAPESYSLAVPNLSSDPALRRAWRTLLLGPVLLRRDDPDAFTALKRSHRALEAEAEEIFGCSLELTQHFARLVRPSGNAQDGTPGLLNPQRRGYDQAALLLCAEIRQRVDAQELPGPDADGCLVLPHATVRDIFADLCDRHQALWGHTIARTENPEILLRDIYDVARQAGLLRGPDAHGNVLVLPTAACYSVDYIDDRHPAATPSVMATDDTVSYGQESLW